MRPTAPHDDRATPAPVRPEPAVRVLLGVFCGLTAAGFVALAVLAHGTDRTFAWTIQPAVTAAFLGSAYGAGFVLSVLCLRSDDWRAVRVPYLTVLVFTWLTTIATFVHLDRMHVVTPGTGPFATPAAWVWLVVYVVIPVGMAVLLPRQPRVDRSAPRVAPTPRWLTVALAVQGAVLGVVGVALYLVPSSAVVLWPWTLTPLTARAVASWLLAFAVASGLSVRDGDLHRLRIATVAYTAFGVLQLVTAVRFADDVDWGTGRGVAYLVGVVVVIATGVAGWVLAARSRRRVPATERA